jgi:hypothetical protein
MLTRAGATRARTTFFSAGFANLHQLVLLQLADSKTGSRHPVLPLLQVSRYWRAFARDFLLEPYQKTQVDPKSFEQIAKGEFPEQPILSKGGAYLRVSPSSSLIQHFSSVGLRNGLLDAWCRPLQFSLTSYCIMECPFKHDDPRFFFSDEGRDVPSVLLLLYALPRLEVLSRAVK